MKKIILSSVAIAGIATFTGCNNYVEEEGIKEIDQERVVKLDELGMKATDYTGRPLWTYSMGRFRLKHPDLASKYIFVVGISQPVGSLKEEQEAKRSATDDAINNLTRALGIDVETLKEKTDKFSNETGELVMGTFKKAVTREMSKHRINLQNFDWFGYNIKEKSKGPRGNFVNESYMTKGLFTLDKAKFDKDFAAQVANTFKKELQSTKGVNQDLRAKLANQAEEIMIETINK